MVAPFNPWAPLLQKTVEAGISEREIFGYIPARVPGSVYSDLLVARKIKNPYFEFNALDCEWVANKWWLYKAVFSVEQPRQKKQHGQTGERMILCFDGLDYKGHVFLNGILLGTHEGQVDSFEFDVTRYLKSKNELEVLIEAAPPGMPQLGRTDEIAHQKSRFGYKWDFCTRLVNLGLTGGVHLKETGGCYIKKAGAKTNTDGCDGEMIFTLYIDSVRDCECSAELIVDGDDIPAVKSEKRLHIKKGLNTKKIRMRVNDVKLWNVIGRGEQNLYKAECTLRCGDEVCDRVSRTIGFRTIAAVQNEGAPDGALPYTFCVNGKKIYIKGLNIVPLDMMLGGDMRERYDALFETVKKCNANILRVWGGGVIENEYFYDLCDKNGVLVWQEFIQSSSGLNSVPSKDKKYLKLLEKAAADTILKKQSHPSLLLYSGGNELKDYNETPLTFDHPNLSLIKKIVERLDKGRIVLPTSASGPLEFIDPSKPGLNHDVHGWWKYCGAEGHYALFNSSDSLFHSEFGVDGMSCYETLAETFEPRNLEKLSMAENESFRFHGEWWDTYGCVFSIFGQPSDINEFILLSQFLQWEGIRYGLEANRRRAFQNSGSIIWQLNEPYPNASCTSLVDYYGREKTAVKAVRAAYAKVNPNIRYDKLVWSSGEKITLGLYLSSDIELSGIKIKATITFGDGITLHESFYEISIGESGKSVNVENISFECPPRGVITVELSGLTGGVLYINKVFLLVAGERGLCDGRALISALKKEGLV